MHRDACNDVTTDKGFATIATYQVSGSKFSFALGRDACNDVTADRDSITVAPVPGSVFFPFMRNDVTASILAPSSALPCVMMWGSNISKFRPAMGRDGCRGDHKQRFPVPGFVLPCVGILATI